MEHSGNVATVKMCKCGRGPYRKSGRNCNFCNAEANRKYRLSLKTPLELARVWRAERRRAEIPSEKARIGFVYFIQAGNGGDIKIGFSVSPGRRLAALQTGSAMHLSLLGVVAGPQSFELAVHTKFRAHRVKGEWFRPAPDILAFIADVCAPADCIRAA